MINLACTWGSMIFMAGISTFTIQQYFQTFFQKKKQAVSTWGICVAYFLWQILSMQSMPTFPAGIRLFISVVSVIIVSFNVVGRLLPKILFSIIYNAIWMLSELMAGCFFMVLNVNYISLDLAGSLFSKLFLLIIVMVLGRFFSHEAVQQLPWKYNAMLMSLPLGSMFIAYHLFMISSKINEVQYIIVSFITVFVMLIVNIMMFQIYMKLSDNLELKRKNSIYQLEIDMYNEHIKEKENTMLEIRKARHDLKHQLIYLLGLSESGQYQKMQNYLKELVHWEPLKGATISNTENSIIDALINYKYGMAKKYGIDFEVKLDVPTSLPFESADLCVVLGNALDNALEANLRGNISKPYINLTMRYNRGNLIVVVENSFDGELKKNSEGKIMTRKNELKNHGIGIDSMRTVVEKYHGFFDIDSTQKKFSLKFIIYSFLE